jgi:membrane-bound lytic murein transglycosylase MltF
MPAAAAEVGVIDRFDPVQNLRGGIEYLRRQFEQLGEITSPYDRLMWAFASYNCGRGFIDFNGGPVNTALELARQDVPHDWARWEIGKHWLMHARVAAKHPDYLAVWNYVDAIQRYHATA